MKFLLLFLLYCLLQSFRVQSTIMRNDETDKAVLLAFKAGLTNGANVLSSWNKTTHFCEWKGVACSPRHPERVSKLDLSTSSLLGTISPSIGNLTFLRRINLTSNKLYGEIPSSISFLSHLEYLDLSYNSFEGEITTGLHNCSNLVHIDFSYNKLVGEIPISLGSLLMLQTLSLSSNNLTGFIPLSFNNLSSLQMLLLDWNNLRGTIPKGLGFLTELQVLQLSNNYFSGIIPNSLYNRSSLVDFSVTNNELEGGLPVDMGNNLPNLRSLRLGLNHLTGEIPASLFNASSLDNILDLSNNKFTGRIPPELGKLCPATFRVQNNTLEATKVEDWDFLKFLSNCSILKILQLDANKLGGKFPSYVANLSTELEELHIGQNYLSGSIPNEIENLSNLSVLSLHDNKLTGTIPESIGKLQQLQALFLGGNMLSGPIPSAIGNLTKLLLLVAYNNSIQGPIPSSIGNLKHLCTLDLSNNLLYGTFPKSIFSLISLSYLDLSKNSLTGKLPVEVGSFQLENLLLSQNKFYGELPEALSTYESLEVLDLSTNHFNGTIPSFLKSLKGLKWLSLSNNNFYGTIPRELSYMYGLQEVHLSYNNLSGIIPTILENLTSLFLLDLSYNHLEGPLPTRGIFSNITGLSIGGNIGLCGGIPQLHLPMCSIQHNKKISPLVFKILIVLLCIILFMISLLAVIFVLRRKSAKSRKKETTKPMFLEESYPKVSYAELAKSTNGFSADNLLGSGLHGSVYKGSLQLKYKQTPHHAIKVFNLEVKGTSGSFLAECDALRRIRHRNLISLVTCCSSTDFKGNDFKALVFDLMPKGSLERWLHRDEDPFLNFIEMLNITVDMADAIDYLHNNCEPSIIHCDLKPSNILLDDDLIAHVGDFGLAKLLPTPISRHLLNSPSSMGIRGTIGYVAPEYGGAGPVSTQADVYSFGIILLEMFTGRAPTDDMFNDGLTLHRFVEMAFPEKIHDIVDPNMISSESDSDMEIQNEQKGDSWNKIHKFLVSVIHVGLMCSKQSPAERKPIKDAANELHSIRDAYIRAGRGCNILKE